MLLIKHVVEIPLFSKHIMTISNCIFECVLSFFVCWFGFFCFVIYLSPEVFHENTVVEYLNNFTPNAVLLLMYT